MMSDIKKTGLELLREPFDARLISKLPKGTKAQNECDYSEKRSCAICGGFHHPKIIHLDYVGHAALTDRLLDCDINWSWEPLALGADGYPAIDKNGGMWIKLTVCGVTRLGYGDAQGKTGGNAVKECIGDALRNAAMRFGGALDLWHKGDLHDALAQNDPAKQDVKQPELKSVSIEDFSEEEQAFLKETAIEMMGNVKEGLISDAYNLLESLDNDEKLVLSRLVDGATRAAVKAYSKTLNGVNDG